MQQPLRSGRLQAAPGYPRSCRRRREGDLWVCPSSWRRRPKERSRRERKGSREGRWGRGARAVAKRLRPETHTERKVPKRGRSGLHPPAPNAHVHARKSLKMKCGMFIEQRVGDVGGRGVDTEMNQTVPVLFIISSPVNHRFTAPESRKPRFREVMSLAKAHTAQLDRNPVPTGSQAQGGATTLVYITQLERG